MAAFHPLPTLGALVVPDIPPSIECGALSKDCEAVEWEQGIEPSDKQAVGIAFHNLWADDALQEMYSHSCWCVNVRVQFSSHALPFGVADLKD